MAEDSGMIPVAIRLTPNHVRLIDQLVNQGVHKNRADACYFAVKLYLGGEDQKEVMRSILAKAIDRGDLDEVLEERVRKIVKSFLNVE